AGLFALHTALWVRPTPSFIGALRTRGAAPGIQVADPRELRQRWADALEDPGESRSFQRVVGVGGSHRTRDPGADRGLERPRALVRASRDAERRDRRARAALVGAPGAPRRRPSRAPRPKTDRSSERAPRCESLDDARKLRASFPPGTADARDLRSSR